MQISTFSRTHTKYFEIDVFVTNNDRAVLCAFISAVVAAAAAAAVGAGAGVAGRDGRGLPVVARRRRRDAATERGAAQGTHAVQGHSQGKKVIQLVGV